MPGLEFNADEMFTAAEQIERNGEKFYRDAAGRFPQAAELLTRLADMEKRHVLVFSEMHKAISARESEPSAADPDGQGALFAQAMADTRVFPVTQDPATILKGNETLEQILLFAIGREKDSVIFYLGMKDMVPRAAGKERLDLIVKEEMSHIAWITAELGRLA